MSRLICIDPGLTTGYAIFEGLDLIHYGSFHLWDFLPRLIREPRASLVLCEKITVRAGNFNPVGIEVTGVLKYLAETSTPEIPVKFQIPSEMRGPNAWGSELLKLIVDGNYANSQHAKDAVAHGLAYYSKQGVLRANHPYHGITIL